HGRWTPPKRGFALLGDASLEGGCAGTSQEGVARPPQREARETPTARTLALRAPCHARLHPSHERRRRFARRRAVRPAIRACVREAATTDTTGACGWHTLCPSMQSCQPVWILRSESTSAPRRSRQV